MERLRPIPELKGKSLTSLKVIAERYNKAVERVAVVYESIGSNLGPDRLNSQSLLRLPEATDKNFLETALKIGQERASLKASVEERTRATREAMQQKTLPFLEQKIATVNRIITIEEQFEGIGDLQQRSSVYAPEELSRINCVKDREMVLLTTANIKRDQSEIISEKQQLTYEWVESIAVQHAFTFAGEEISDLTTTQYKLLKTLEVFGEVPPAISELARVFWPGVPLATAKQKLAKQLVDLRRKMAGSNLQIINTTLKERTKGVEAHYKLALQILEADVGSPAISLPVAEFDKGIPDSKKKEGLESLDQKTSTAIVTSSRENVIRKIVQKLPEENLRCVIGDGVDLENYSKEVQKFADLALAVYEGKVPLTNPLSIIGAAEHDKAKIAGDIVSQHLVGYIFVSSEEDLARFHRQWNRVMTEVVDYLGRRRSKEILKKVVDNLPDPIRGLFLSVSSVKLMTDLEYIDIEECSESRYTSHLRNATFIVDEHGRDEAFCQLLSTLDERIDEGVIDPVRIIDNICRLEYGELIIEKMTESARRNDCRDILVSLFSSHPSTARHRIKLDDEIRGA